MSSCKSYSHFFSKKFQHICISLDVNFNESLTNDLVSFEPLGPGLQLNSTLETHDLQYEVLKKSTLFPSYQEGEIIRIYHGCEE